MGIQAGYGDAPCASAPALHGLVEFAHEVRYGVIRDECGYVIQRHMVCLSAGLTMSGAEHNNR